MSTNELAAAKWFKSTRSNGQNNCVEVAKTTSAIAIRDSKDPQGGILFVDRASWKILTSWIRQGHLDLAP